MWDTLYIGLTPMIFPWGVTDYLTRQLQVIVKCLECILHISLTYIASRLKECWGGSKWEFFFRLPL